MPFRHERRYHREAIGVFASAGLPRETRSLFHWGRGGKYLRPSASVERSGRLAEYNGINDLFSNKLTPTKLEKNRN